MGTDYLQVHLFWTIPPATLLWWGLRRIRTRREVFRTTALIAIAVVSTIPWDSYLIRNKIWSYPSSSVVGPTLCSIPLEEVFFFFIQTYITSSIYAFTSRPVLHVLFLPRSARDGRRTRLAGSAFFVAVAAASLAQVRHGTGRGTYLALILAWVSPFLALLWWTASTHITRLPYSTTLIPILLPTIYLWTCDAVALQRGTWVITAGTKLGVSAFGLEIEEAIFFLLTNVLVVFGVVAIDFTMAVHDLSAVSWGIPQHQPSPTSVLRCILASPDDYPQERLSALASAADVVRRKSRSFWTASFVFEGPLRLDLLSLYAWCRVTDDFVDTAPSASDATALLESCRQFLSHLSTSCSDKTSRLLPSLSATLAGLPPSSRPPFELVSTLPIPRHPLHELLSGYDFDLLFFDPKLAPQIRSDEDLLLYASRVASSVAELCVNLVWAHDTTSPTPTTSSRREIIGAARTMGMALQLVNIVRDVEADALVGRCYLPGISAQDVAGGVISLSSLRPERLRLLELADKLADTSRPSIARLPTEARGPMLAACDVYLAIGSEIRRRLLAGEDGGRASLSKWARVRVAWSAMGAASQ